VGLPFPSALGYGRCTCSCRFSHFHRVTFLASSLGANRNSLFSDTDSVGIRNGIRSAALSSSLADEMDLGASIIDLVYFLHPHASTLSWSARTLFRVGLSARGWLFRPTGSHTTVLYRGFIFIGRIPKKHN